VLDVLGRVTGGRLAVRWIYSENLHAQATIEALAARFVAALRALVAHCLSPDAGGYTPSDFRRARLAQPVIDRIAASIQVINRRDDEAGITNYGVTPPVIGVGVSVGNGVMQKLAPAEKDGLGYIIYGGLDGKVIEQKWVPAKGGEPRTIAIRRRGDIYFPGNGPSGGAPPGYGGSGYTSTASVCGPTWPYADHRPG